MAAVPPPIQMAAVPPPLPLPKRGGRHVFDTRAIFLGGSKLSSNYRLINPSLSYNSQLRGNPKISSANENSLIKERHDVSSVTFKGTIELTESSLDELDKDRLIEKLNERVNHNGLQNLFAMPHPADPTLMTDLSPTIISLLLLQLLLNMNLVKLSLLPSLWPPLRLLNPFKIVSGLMMHMRNC
jgi:hypothetical protein